MGENHPLIKLYGNNVVDLVLEEIRYLADNSNFTFDKKYIDVGISFINIKAQNIIDGKEKPCSLKSLVSSSFGEAAIYKYNVCGGVL